MKINSSELQQIIKEEALRLKHKMMLENEKATIMKRLQEIDECMMDETPTMAEAPMMEAATPQEAQQWLNVLVKNPKTAAPIQKSVKDVLALGANAPQWAQAVTAGKNLQDKAQYNQAYQDIYKLWSQAYTNFFVKNPKMPFNWDINTNTFTPVKSSGTGLGFGMGTQHESVDKTKK